MPPAKRGIVKSIQGSVSKIFRKTGGNGGNISGGGDDDTDGVTPISVRRFCGVPPFFLLLLAA